MSALPDRTARVDIPPPTFMNPSINVIRAARAPRWSRKRLIGMLIDCYGASPSNGVDFSAVGHYVGVSPATVRRWVGGRPAPGRRMVIPKARLTQLQCAPAEVERRNQQRYEHALAALASINDEKSILPAWRERRWLDQHMVVVIAIRGRPWLQVAITNGSKRALAELLRRGAMISAIEVPTQFHAQVLMQAVMVRQQAWRVHPALERLSVGRTQVWMDDAPPVDLTELANALGIERVSTR